MKIKKLRSLLCFFMFFATAISAISAQNNVAFSLEGVVKDETGTGIPGATIQIGGTNLGTITDIDGKYVLNGTLSDGTYNIVASTVGYSAITKSIAISTGKLTNLDFDLKPDILNLDEVVVTGASPTSTRKQLGNSISVVKQDALRDAGTSNTLGALSGKVMGAQVTQNSGDPAGGFSVRLRGAGSINSSSDPLYVIDGVVMDNSSQNVINLSADTQGAYIQSGQNRLVDINPDDIEHIEVLNGAAAAAIYGSRAGNGVVQIFTKRGKSGKTTVNFSTSFIVSDLRKEVAMSSYGKRFGVIGDPSQSATSSTYLNTTQDRLTLIRSLGLSATGLDASNVKYSKFPNNAILVNDQYNVTRYDYWKDIFTTATGTDNNLSFSGGSEKTQFFVSGGYYNNDGILKNTNFKKYTLRANIDQTLADWAKLSVSLAGNLSQSKDMPNGNNFFNPISGVFIIDNVWDLNRRDAGGNLLPVERVRINPLSATETFNLTQSTTRVIGNVKLSLYPVKGLSVDLIGGADNYTLTGHEYHPRLPYYDEVAGNISTGFYPDGYVGLATSTVRLFNHDLLANYNTKLTGDISSTTTAGYQIQYGHSEYGASDGNGLASYAPRDASLANVASIITLIHLHNLIALSVVILRKKLLVSKSNFISLAVFALIIPLLSVLITKTKSIRKCQPVGF